MEDLRARRLKEVWERALAQRLADLYAVLSEYEAQQGRRTAALDAQAQIADLAQDPVFRKVVYAPMSAEISADSFTPLLASVPALRTTWYNEREREFCALISTALDDWEPPAPESESDPDVDPLALAVATFCCTMCKRAEMRWPAVLAHRCARPTSETDRMFVQQLDALCVARGLPLSWGGTQAMFKANKNMEKECVMIRACGLDPRRATVEDMERPGCAVRLFCKICAVPAVGYLEAYSWKAAVAHERPRCSMVFGPSRDAVDNKWQVLDAEHTATVLELEAALCANPGQKQPVDAFGCAHCCVRSDTPPMTHCMSEHAIEDPKIDEDYYVHLDSTASTFGRASQIQMTSPTLIYPEHARGDRVAVKYVKAGRAFFSMSLFKAIS